MDTTDFDFEFYSEVENLNERFRTETERKLRTLAEGHSDMIGASVALEEDSNAETPHAYEARVIAFVRPENVVTTEKGETIEEALWGAVNALERQVRKERERRRDLSR
jgi:ribosome-associated translation inhibitor RaiA